MGSNASIWTSLQLLVILGVLHILATDSIAMHRFQVGDACTEECTYLIIGCSCILVSDFRIHSRCPCLRGLDS